MKNNLLSLVQLLEKNYIMRLEKRALYVFDDKNRFILKALLLKNKTFKININTRTYKCLTIVVIDENWVWHLRFAHLNFKSLN